MDGCFIQTDGKADANRDVFYTFANVSESGQPAYIRIVHWYNIGESGCTVYDLNYDGRVYTISWLENGKRQTKDYLYLRRFTGLAENENADHHSYEHYVLVNDDTVFTWKELMQSLTSSQSGAAIDHITLFSRYLGDPSWEFAPYDVKQIELEFQGEILYTTTDAESCEKVSLLMFYAESLSHAPKNNSLGLGLNLILTLGNGKTVVIEPDLNEPIYRSYGEYWRYNHVDESIDVSTLWYYLGIEAWPDEVYEAYPDAYRE